MVCSFKVYPADESHAETRDTCGMMSEAGAGPGYPCVCGGSRRGSLAIRSLAPICAQVHGRAVCWKTKYIALSKRLCGPRA